MIWWLPHILLICWNIANAKHDSDRIKQHKKIYHGVNAALYIICVGLITYFGRVNPYIFAASAIFGRLFIFNTSLYILRGLKWYYVSPERKAVTDQILYRIFGANGKLQVFTFAALWIATVILDYYL